MTRKLAAVLLAALGLAATALSTPRPTQQGPSIDGMVAAADRMLGIIDSHTKIIPGHGPLADRAVLQEYRNMLAGVRDAVAPLVHGGRTIDQVIAAKPTARWDAQWGQSFIKPDAFVRIVYDSISRRKP